MNSIPVSQEVGNFQPKNPVGWFDRSEKSRHEPQYG